MAPRSSNLILWRNAGNTGGPFRRTFARAEMWYRPLDANTATPTGHKCSDAPWIWGNLVCWCCVCMGGGEGMGVGVVSVCVIVNCAHAPVTSP